MALKIPADKLKELAIEMLEKRGVEGKEIIADHFVEAELRGHSSHGVQRLLPLVKGVELGTIRKRLDYEVLKSNGDSLWIDAKSSIG